MPTWETTTDWDAAQSEEGVHHEQPAGTDWAPADKIEKGLASTSSASLPSFKAYFPLNDDSGTTMTDVAGSLDGSINGATLNEPGLLGQTAYALDGSDDYMTFPDTSLFTLSQTWSVVFWVKTRSITGTENYLWHPRGESDLWMSVNSNNYVFGAFGGGNGTQTIQPKSSSTGTWALFGATCDGSGGVTALVREAGDASTSTTSAGLTATGKDKYNTLGAQDQLGDNYSDAIMSDVQFYSGEISTSQFNTIYDAFGGTSTYVSSKKQL